MCKDQNKYDSTEEHQKIRDEYLKSSQPPNQSGQDSPESSTQRMFNRLHKERHDILARLEAINYIMDNWTDDVDKAVNIARALRTLGYDR